MQPDKPQASPPAPLEKLICNCSLPLSASCSCRWSASRFSDSLNCSPIAAGPSYPPTPTSLLAEFLVVRPDTRGARGSDELDG
ncbi:hypothetical protein SLA2020_031590 [Shorea laevis]